MIDAVPSSKSSNSQEWVSPHSCINGETTAVLVCSHCYNKTPYTGCLKPQALISHGSGDCKFKVKPGQIEVLMRILFPVYIPLCGVLTWPKSWLSCLLLFFQGTNSIMRAPPSWPCLTLNTSQTPHSQYYHIGIRASTCAFQENTNIQSTIPHKHQKLLYV